MNNGFHMNDSLEDEEIVPLQSLLRFLIILNALSLEQAHITFIQYRYKGESCGIYSRHKN